MHLTGPLRAEVKKVSGHEPLLIAALVQTASAAADGGAPSHLRPLPYLIYFADGDSDRYNVFADNKTLQPTQKVFKKHPMADCSPPPAMSSSLGLQQGHPIHLGTVLSRCPHFLPSMRTKWGMPKAEGEEGCCVLL